MPFTEMVVTIAIAAAFALTFIHLLRLLAAMVMHRTIRRAIDRDPVAAEPLLSRLSTVEPEKSSDDRTGILLIAFGVALASASLVIGETSWMRYGVAGALFPLIIGAAMWLRHAALERSKRAQRAGEQ